MVGKDEFSLRNIENLLPPRRAAPSPTTASSVKKRARASVAQARHGGVLVVGIDSLLMTQLAQLLPAGAARRDRRLRDARQGRGGAPQRLQQLPHDGRRSAPERVIQVEWGDARAGRASVYAVDVAVEAADRQGLLRDISDVFAREKINVIGVKTQIGRKARAWMTFEVSRPQQIADVHAAQAGAGGRGRAMRGVERGARRVERCIRSDKSGRLAEI